MLLDVKVIDAIISRVAYT